jgi:hypothetical protein
MTNRTRFCEGSRASKLLMGLYLKSARSRAIGGIVFGIGMALFEHSTIHPACTRYMRRCVAYLTNGPLCWLIRVCSPSSIISNSGRLING